MNSLWSALEEELARREAQHLRRRLSPVPENCRDLASNDYLGLSRHEDIVRAAKNGAQRDGAGGRASRLVSGDSEEFRLLEWRLAQFKETEAALVFNSGYAANLGVIPTLAVQNSFIACHKRNHASLVDACRMAAALGAVVRFYESTEKLDRLLQSAGRPRRLIVTDAVFSMDGDLAPLPEIIALAECHEATVILDDAHGTGTLGIRGKGATEYWNVQSQYLIQIGTLSKALASQGGFVTGPQVLIDYLVNFARTFVYTTALNPAAASAALASVRALSNDPGLVMRLAMNGQLLRDGLLALGFDVAVNPTPIIPIIAGEAEVAVQWSEELRGLGFWCPAIRPPTVAQGTARLRLTACAAWDKDDIEEILGAFKKLKDR